ncbi:MAG: aminotransferase [Rhodothalassiaceae bacterium]|nr:MAG: aminotransferase [Rhodothalassiaceae bacterium]
MPRTATRSEAAFAAAAFLGRLDALFAGLARPVPLHEPLFGKEEEEAVRRAVASGWVSSAGPEIARFEERLAALTGARHAVAVVNGTAALHLAFRAVGVRPGDEVIMPPLTFVATANAAVHAGAVPHFVDIEPARLGLDPAALARRLEAVAERRPDGVFNRWTGRRIAAVALVHVFGVPACDAEVAEVCREWGLPLVEDAAEALGSRRAGRHAGLTGACGALSFNGNKIVTTGGGGAVITDDEALAGRVRHWATVARRPHAFRFFHDETAFNYRLPNLNAALGLAQLARLDAFLAAKKALHDRYREALAGLPGVRLREAPADAAPNHWLIAAEIDVPDTAARDAVIARAAAAGIGLRPVWDLLHRLPMYRDAPRGDLATAEALEPRLVCLPSGPAVALAIARRRM